MILIFFSFSPLTCLQRTLPWGTFSSLRLVSPTESDDGPIMWVRPGEQMIPVADVPKSPFKRKRWAHNLNTLTDEASQYFESLLNRDGISRDFGLCEFSLYWAQVSVVCIPYWDSLSLSSPHNPSGVFMKYCNNTCSHIRSSSRSSSSVMLCCNCSVPDEAITPSLFVSVIVSLLLTHKLFLTHTLTPFYSFWWVCVY